MADTSYKSFIDASLNAIKLDSRICFSIEYYSSEAEAEKADKIVRERGYTYNGGYFHGMSCGRETSRDYTDPVHGRLYAVTF